jgi:hypothetical protein
VVRDHADAEVQRCRRFRGLEVQRVEEEEV